MTMDLDIHILSAVVLTIVSVVVLGTSTKFQMPTEDNYKYALFYSFILYIVGGVFLVVGAALVIISVNSLTKLLLV